MKKHFSTYISDRTYPGYMDIQKIQTVEPLLGHRNCATLKVWLQNYYKKHKNNGTDTPVSRSSSRKRKRVL